MSHRAQHHFRLIVHDLHMTALGRDRSIRVCLPPAYLAEAGRAFRVMYLLDGQNLFEDATSYAGAWHLGEKVAHLPSHQQMILVGIDNGGKKRMHEYLPIYRASRHAEGEAYLAFIFEQVIPFVNAEYRTIPDPRHTYIGGSSLGGLLAFYAVTRYGHYFGRGGILSPSFWYQPKVFNNIHHYPGNKIYILASNTESQFMGKSLSQAYRELKESGYHDAQLRVVLRPDGRHDEYFWGSEFTEMLLWLQAD